MIGIFSLQVYGQVASPARSANPSVNRKSGQQIIVGPNIHVSKAFSEKQHAEIYLAADPKNPNNLLGGSMVWAGEKNVFTVVAYASSDGGKTWSSTLNFDDDFYHSDPASGFGADGTAYFLQIVASRAPEFRRYTYIHRSKDGGRRGFRL